MLAIFSHEVSSEYLFISERLQDLFWLIFIQLLTSEDSFPSCIL